MNDNFIKISSISKKILENSCDNEKQIKWLRLPVVQWISFRVTQKCPYNCIYCTQRSMEENMDLKDWIGILKEVSEESEQMHLNITGGEPLLIGDKLYGKDGIIENAKKLNAAISINTTGYFNKTEIWEKILDYGIRSIYISLDSFKNDENFKLTKNQDALANAIKCFKVIDNVKKHKDYKEPIVYLSTVITKKNYLHYPNLIKWVIENKIPVNDFNPLELKGFVNKKNFLSREEIKEFKEETLRIIEEYDISSKYPFLNRRIKDIYSTEISTIEEIENGRYCSKMSDYCYTSPTSLYVLPDGRIFNCTYIMEGVNLHPEYHEDFNFNIKENTLLEIRQALLQKLNKTGLPNKFLCLNYCGPNLTRLNLRIKKELKYFRRVTY
ncbi:MAG: radical SAM protein [Halanaerobiales bacterium]|nr:radical SAM protein [Halanaerobiales bacterium]